MALIREDLYKPPPMKPEDMLGKILQYVIKIGNRDIKEIVSCALNEKEGKAHALPRRHEESTTLFAPASLYHIPHHAIPG